MKQSHKYGLAVRYAAFRIALLLVHLYPAYGCTIVGRIKVTKTDLDSAGIIPLFDYYSPPSLWHDHNTLASFIKVLIPLDAKIPAVFASSSKGIF